MGLLADEFVDLVIEVPYSVAEGRNGGGGESEG
jgi:hypothetical protein